MWDALFVISFVINVALLLYFLKPQALKTLLPKKVKKHKVVGYYDDDDSDNPVPIKDDSYDYSDVFGNKGWRNEV
jgi:hypothetical protein